MAREWREPAFGEPENSLGGVRLLVLGESNYHHEAPIGSEVPDINEWVVGDVVAGTRYPFYNKISRLIINGGRTWLTQEASVAF